MGWRSKSGSTFTSTLGIEGDLADATPDCRDFRPPDMESPATASPANTLRPSSGLVCPACHGGPVRAALRPMPAKPPVIVPAWALFGQGRCPQQIGKLVNLGLFLMCLAHPVRGRFLGSQRAARSSSRRDSSNM